MEQPGSRRISPSYQLFTLVLSLYALGVLTVQTMVRLTPETREILDHADHGVCAIFFVDFVISLIRAPDRRRYFFTWGWLDLLSSIPMVDALRWGRVARVLRVFRILRGLRATRVLAMLVVRRRAQSAFLAASLVALLLLVFCSIAVLNFETAPESNIKTADDAVWWAFTTITTVGYGDRFPVTAEGRFVAAILMCSGVGLFGTFSGFLAAWFIGPQVSEDAPAVSVELRALREEVELLRRAIDQRADARSSDPPVGRGLGGPENRT
jgi:voltage-gated potassium channel